MKVQAYAPGGWRGVVSAWLNTEDRPEISDFPSGEELVPYYQRYTQDFAAYTAPVEPAGAGSGFFGIYYVDATTGECSACRFDKEHRLVGHEAGRGYVKNTGKYLWYEQGKGEGGSSGTYEIIKPVHIYRKGRNYWRYTIATYTHSGVTAIAVLDAATYKVVHIFKEGERDEFLRWVDGEEIDLSTEAKGRGYAEEVHDVIEHLQSLEKKMKAEFSDSATPPQ